MTDTMRLPHRLRALALLAARQSGLAPGEVKDGLGLSPAHTSQIIYALITEGLAKGVSDKTDGRRRVITITRQGRAALAQAAQCWSAAAKALRPRRAA